MNEKTVVIGIALLMLFVAFAVVTEALCALGDNYLLRSRPMVWVIKLVRWVKRSWYDFAYQLCDREVNYYKHEVTHCAVMFRAANTRLLTVWIRRRVACHTKLVELSHVE
jgi:hypothetical protein